MDNQTRGGDVRLVSPRFDIAKSSKLVALQCNDGLRLTHLGSQILMGTFGNTGATNFCGIFNGLKYGIDIFFVRWVSHHNFYFFHYVLNLCKMYWLDNVNIISP